VLKQVLGEHKRENLAGLALEQMNEADRMGAEHNNGVGYDDDDDEEVELFQALKDPLK
jgi:hypothetical protein